MTGIANLDDLLGAIGDLRAAPTLPVLIERLEHALAGHHAVAAESADGVADHGLSSSGAMSGRTAPVPTEGDVSWGDSTAEALHLAAELAADVHPMVSADLAQGGPPTGDGLVRGRDARVLQLLAVAFHSLFEELVPAAHEDMTLTSRECEVLRWFADGKSAEDVATILHISSGTVMFHYRRAAERLGTLNRTHTVVEAMRRGMIPVTRAG